MGRERVEPVLDEDGWERHPAFAVIGASRGSVSPPGASLFDSEIRHQHIITLRIKTARRKRDLSRDWIHADKTLIEVAMSMSQWAEMISSLNTGDGVPCTLEMTGGTEFNHMIPGVPYSPRMQQSLDEVTEAAEKMLDPVRKAFAAVQEKPNKGNIRNLEIALQNATPNVTFVAKSLSEHTETTINKAKADLEAYIVQTAERHGLDPAELGEMPQLGSGDES